MANNNEQSFGYSQTSAYGWQYSGPQHYGVQNYTADQCSGQQAAVVVVQPTPQTNAITGLTSDNMILAILACIFCFWPLGLVAIFKANDSQNALARGDHAEAERKGREAKNYSLISIGIGVCCYIILIIIIALNAAGVFRKNNDDTYSY